MAKTNVELLISDFESRPVSSFMMAYTQPTDSSCQVTGIPIGGVITVKVRALENGNLELFNWMVQKDLSKTGVIVFYDRNGSETKWLYFKDAYCVNYLEYWDDKEEVTKSERTNRELAHWEEITISCRLIKYTNNKTEVRHMNEWKLELSEKEFDNDKFIII